MKHLLLTILRHFSQLTKTLGLINFEFYWINKIFCVSRTTITHSPIPCTQPQIAQSPPQRRCWHFGRAPSPCRAVCNAWTRIFWRQTGLVYHWAWNCSTLAVASHWHPLWSCRWVLVSSGRPSSASSFWLEGVLNGVRMIEDDLFKWFPNIYLCHFWIYWCPLWPLWRCAWAGSRPGSACSFSARLSTWPGC